MSVKKAKMRPMPKSSEDSKAPEAVSSTNSVQLRQAMPKAISSSGPAKLRQATPFPSLRASLFAAIATLIGMKAVKAPSTGAPTNTQALAKSQ